MIFTTRIKMFGSTLLRWGFNPLSGARIGVILAYPLLFREVVNE